MEEGEDGLPRAEASEAGGSEDPPEGSLEEFRRSVLPGRTVVEVTEVLKRLCHTGLGPGGMVHPPAFSLLEAVSAIELGDPKVDVGSIPEARNCGTPADLLAAGLAPLRLEYDILLGVLDGLLALEASWYKGNFLAETVYTSLYLHDLDRLEGNSVLRACCELARLTCLRVVSVVHRAGVSDEEDFCTSYQGLPLHVPGRPDGADETKRWQGFASRVASKLSKIALRTQPSDEVSLDCEELPIPGVLTAKQMEALASRVRLRQALLGVIECLERDGDVDARELDRIVSDARSCLGSIRETHRFGGVKDGAKFAFFRYLNKAHMPAVPPRTVEHCDPDEVVGYFESFLDHAVAIAKTDACKTVGQLERHLADLSDANPETVARSLQCLRLGRLGTRDLVSASVGLTAKYLESEPELGVCLVKCQEVEEAFARALCFNKCQQHRKCRRVLQTLNSCAEELRVFQIPLQALRVGEGEEGMDPEALQRLRTELSISACVRWLCCLSHRVALRQLLLGFDLELYQSGEYLMVYWYCERLLAGQISAVQEWNALLARVAEAGRRLKGKGKKRVVTAAEDEVMCTIFILESTRLAFNATVRMLAALEKRGTVTRPELPFNTEENLYSQRFSPLHLATNKVAECFPEPLCYDAYAYATNVQDMALGQLCESAGLGFGNALRLLSHLKATYGERGSREEDVGALERTCKANQIAVKLAGRSDKLKCDLGVEGRALVLRIRT